MFDAARGWTPFLLLVMVVGFMTDAASGESGGFSPLQTAMLGVSPRGNRHHAFHEASRLPLSQDAFALAGAPMSPADMPYVDLDQYGVPGSKMPLHSGEEPWHWQILPDGIIFPSYLAGTKEPRFAAYIIDGKDDGGLFDNSLGTRVGLLRFGNTNSLRPEGWQVDAEGAAHLRLDFSEDLDVRSADFRAGLPITYGQGRYRFKFAYYHLSSHLGDEFLLKNPGFPRLNYSRDVLTIGHMIYLTDQLRIYGEAGWAFKSDVGLPWEFQFGIDYLPCGPTGFGGAPFFGVNGHLREELDFGGAITVQGGWAWRGTSDTGMLRAGLHYYNGASNQFSFFREHEEQIGFAVWYDF